MKHQVQNISIGQLMNFTFTEKEGKNERRPFDRV
jgi:hypothetical protein